MTIVIVGAGIIGVATAYHLQEIGCKEDIHFIEVCSEPFNGASGYAAGFVAANWYASAMLPLGELSFSLHKSMADANNGSEVWGYSGSTGISLGQDLDIGNAQEDVEGGDDWLLQGTSRAQVAQRNEQYGKTDNQMPSWLRIGKGQSCEVLSGAESTAQVDPLRMCQFMLKKVEEKGGRVHSACAPEQIVKDAQGNVSSVKLDNGETIPFTKLVFTSGPWTPQVFKKLFPHSSKAQKRLDDIGKLAGHSIIVKSPQWKTAAGEGRFPEGCHAVFATTFSSSAAVTGSQAFAPEIFSRLPDEICIAGLNSSTAALPERADKTVINDADIDALKEAARRIIRLTEDETAELEIVRKGHCFRPTTSSGRPFISEIPAKLLADDCNFAGDGGVWLSAGHGPWGISLSQGTGRVLAELILRMTPSINTKPFSL